MVQLQLTGAWVELAPQQGLMRSLGPLRTLPRLSWQQPRPQQDCHDPPPQQDCHEVVALAALKFAPLRQRIQQESPTLGGTASDALSGSLALTTELTGSSPPAGILPSTTSTSALNDTDSFWLLGL